MPWSSHSIVRMPWDVGTSKFCVGHEPMVNFLKIDNILIPPDVIEPPPSLPAQTSLRIAAGRLMPGLVRLLKTVPWPDQLEAKRHMAMTMWQVLVEDNVAGSTLGEQIHDAMLEFRGCEKIQKLVQMTFSSNSTSTLSKRGSALIKYANWHRGNTGTSAFPISEPKLYEHLNLQVLSGVL